MSVDSLIDDVFPFPIRKEATTAKVAIQLSSALPAALAKTATNAAATSKSGDKLFCLKIMSSQAAQESKPMIEPLAALQAP